MKRLAFALCAILLTPTICSAVEILKIATLVPQSSPWGKVCDVWAKAVKEKSGGRLELQISYNPTTARWATRTPWSARSRRAGSTAPS